MEYTDQLKLQFDVENHLLNLRVSLIHLLL